MSNPDQEGKDAWLAGIDKSQNPYPDNTMENLSWSLGWLLPEAISVSPQEWFAPKGKI
jgi:hypothetical protein